MTIKKTKARNFSFIIYPESIPEDFVECLEKLGVPMAISPLHDLDKTERKFEELSADEQKIIKDGGSVYKKAHYHVLYIAKNPVTVESVRNKIKRVLGNKSLSHIEIVDYVQNYFLYLTHESKDAIAKNKHKYDKKDIIYINDFDIERYITLDEHEKNDLLNKVCGLIYQFGFENMFDFLDFYHQSKDDYDLPNLDVLNTVIKGNTGLLRLHFDGAYQQNKRKMEQEKNNEK